MLELADRLLAVLDAGSPVVIATAVTIEGSAPNGAGTSMAMLPGGQVVGTISGGCVEGALFIVAEELLLTGEPVIERFGFDANPEDPDAIWAPALRCGGRIEVLVQRVTSADTVIIDALRRASSGVATTLRLSLTFETLATPVRTPDGCAGRVYEEHAEGRARCLVVGAVEFAVAVTNAATMLGYSVTVYDPRPVFLTPERFPAAHELVLGWPSRTMTETPIDASTVVILLSHDDRFDAEVLDFALRGRAGYVGAMGSRRTHQRRLEALHTLGTPDLHRLHSPVGLDIGAETPMEVAVAVMAEVIAVRAGASGRPLSEGNGPIHHRRLSVR